MQIEEVTVKQLRQYLFGLGALSLFVFSSHAMACTDIIVNARDHYFVGRNFDWPIKDTYLVVNPTGLEHQSDDLSVKHQTLKWTSKYGSVTFDLADANNQPDRYAVLDGINQYSLTAAALWLQDSAYPNPPHQQVIATGLWVQYILDNAKTVKEAIQLAQNITIEPVVFNKQAILLHLVMHDAGGHSAVLEYLNGKLVVFQAKTMPVPVLTNNNYQVSLLNLQKYQGFGGSLTLPSGYDSEDRFVRAAYFIKQLSPLSSSQAALNSTFQILGEVSEPAGAVGGATMWSVVYDLSNQTVYYRDIDNPKIRFVRLNQFDFSKGAPSSFLLINNKLAGNVRADLEDGMHNAVH